MGVIEAVADLAADVDHVPDGKTLAFGQISGDAEALDVFGSDTETAVVFARPVKQDDVLVTKVARAFRLLNEALDEVGAIFAGEVEVESFEGDGTIGSGIRGAVDRGLLGVRNFTQNFETPDFAGRHAGPRTSNGALSLQERRLAAGGALDDDSWSLRRFRVTEVTGTWTREQAPERPRAPYCLRFHQSSFELLSRPLPQPSGPACVRQGRRGGSECRRTDGRRLLRQR